MQINWLWVGAASFAVCGSIFGYYVSRRQWNAAALLVGIANMLVAGLHTVAPFRGVFDPNYNGYNMGLIHVGAGIMVTLVTGTILTMTVWSACLAVQNKAGKQMRWVVLTDGFLVLNFVLSAVYSTITNPGGSSRIKLGEYLTIPGLLADLILVLILIVPLALSTLWAFRRIR